MPSVHPVVVGAEGRVGSALVNAVRQQHPNPCIIRRGQRLSDAQAELKGPIYIATQAAALPQALSVAVPRSRHSDLVLLQNGALHPILDAAGVSPPLGGAAERGRQGHKPEVTQLLLYAAATGDGRLTDGGRSAVCGRWAEHVQTTLAAAGVGCRIVGPAQLQAEAVEKLLWATIFWLLCQVLGGITVGEVVSHHESRVSELLGELLPLAQQDLVNRATAIERSQEGISGQVFREAAELLGSDQAGVVERLCSYSRRISTAVPSVEMAVREFRERNGFFVKAQVQQAGSDSLAGTAHMMLLKKALGPQLAAHCLQQAGLCSCLRSRGVVASTN